VTFTVRGSARRLVAAIEGPSGPRLAWTLRGYRPEQLRGDGIAGMTVAALIVPLSIGYAAVAGLPPEVGLYASIAPLLAYAVFGSGRRLVLGPDAATAALIAATIAPLAASSDDRVRLASVLALLVAAIFVAMRVARMGFLADFLSRPILVGYLAGVGITVTVGQIEKILGGPAISDALSVLRGTDWTRASASAVLDAMGTAISRSGATFASVAVGGGVLIALVLGKRFAPRVPMALPAMIVALVVSALADLQSRGVSVLGPIPAGLPPLGIPLASPSELLTLLPGAIGIAVLSFADTSATGRSFAARHNERTDANRELVALAAADAAGALIGGYPVSSSASRTAASEAAGATSQMVGIIAATAVAVVLVLLTRPLAFLPTPALAAVILISVMGIIDLRQLRALWGAKKSEGTIALVAMSGVVFYGTLIGVGVAALLAALNIVRRAATPSIVEEVRLPDGVWADASRNASGAAVFGLVAVRLSGPLFFANATALRSRIDGLLGQRPDARTVVLDLGATSGIDLTAADTLRDSASDLDRRGIQLVVVRPLGTVRDDLHRFGLERLMTAAGGPHGSIDSAARSLGLELTRGPAEPSARVADLPADGAAEPADSGAGLPGPSPDHGDGPTRRAGDPLVPRVLGILALVVVFAVLAAGLLARFSPGAITDQVTVPNLVGLPLTRASGAATDAGFIMDAPIYVVRDSVAEGTVVEQIPPPGTIADRGSAIAPTVATARVVVVPDVAGMREADAILALTSAGLQASRSARSDQAIPAGVVLTTDPGPLASVRAGSTVIYVVSTGPEASPTPAPTVTTQPSAPRSGAPSVPPTQSVAPSVPPTAPPEPSGSPIPTPTPETTPSAMPTEPSPTPAEQPSGT